MRIALAGVGRMGSAIAGQLRAGGHHLALYDPALPPGGDARPSLAAAARGADVVFLCLPDAAAVAASLPGLAQARPPIVVDLTSSLPETTRQVAASLASLGVGFLDCPLSGGVAGARAGALTAMAGGDLDLVDRARPVLAEFAAKVMWAGPLGAGHAVKALNNALSAVSLAGTAEMLVTAVAQGVEEGRAVACFNAGPARSQNSEVKYPRDVLPRSYAAGFTAGLMEKDFASALQVAEARAVAVPFLAAAFEAWREATGVMGEEADFTRVHAVVEGRSRRRSPAGAPAAAGDPMGVLAAALAAVNLLAAREAVAVAAAEGLERACVLEIVNASSGRSEATRSGLAGEPDASSLARAADLARRSGTWAPLTCAAAELVAAAPGRPGSDHQPDLRQKPPSTRS